MAELIYGTRASTRDPASFAFAHGGKDGTPFPVDRTTYDQTIEVLRCAVRRARVDRSDRLRALKRLAGFASRAPGTADAPPIPDPPSGSVQGSLPLEMPAV